MKRLLYILFFALFVVSFKGKAQDKLFLRNGSVLHCKITGISDNTITYTDTTANAVAVTLSRQEVLLAEYRSGEVYIFEKEKKPELTVVNAMMPDETREQRKERKLREWKEKEALLPNGILGFYIPELVLGRLTVSYERLFANKSVGIKIPISLTYDGLGALREASANSSSTSTNSSSTNTNSSTSNNTNNSVVPRTRGTGVITGIDVNYYHDLKPQLKYFFGPRVRYGTDMTLGGIEGMTVQLQNGIMRSSGKRFTSTIAIGFGFFKLSEKYARYGGYEPNQVYPWGSFTWRLGFRL